MTTSTRYILLTLILVLLLHFALLNSHQGYSEATDLRKWKMVFASNTSTSPPPAVPEPISVPTLPPGLPNAVPEEYTKPPQVAFLDRKANATLLMLARNTDILGVVDSMKQIEDRFNKRFRYPWTFLNEEPFTEEFKTWTSAMTDSPTEYGLIDKDQWYQPGWINETLAALNREKMVEKKIIYGGSVTYRNMCRYNSGYFFRHPVLAKYRYYWRVEPSVRFYCDLDFDPLLFMQDQGKVYGFTIALYEYEVTIPSLWTTAIEFVAKNVHYLAKNNAMKFVSNDGGRSYNLCHFWSNLEIADLDFWRSEAYIKFFEHLDKSGGFYYERWGDAPVHTLGAALLADRDKLHFFDEIGYRHEPFEHCPRGAAHSRGKCWCNVEDSFDKQWYSCMKHFERMY